MSVRIMIVEDEQIVAADLESKLSRMGYEVVAIAASGLEAIRLASQLRPHLVLMDIRLQGKMDGTEAARAIHSVVGVPVVFLTAFAGTFLSDPSQMVPPGLCLEKPFSAQQLRAALNAALPRLAPTTETDR